MNYREVSEASRAAYFKAKAELGRHLPVLPFFAGWNAAKHQFVDDDTDTKQVISERTNKPPDSDLYTWIDSIVHEALPYNYEDLNPRELRELLTNALYERLTDKDFQSTYIDLIFQPKEITIEVEGGMQGRDLVFRPSDTPGLYNGYKQDGSLYASDLTQTQVRNIVIFGETGETK